MTAPPGILKGWEQEVQGQRATFVGVGGRSGFVRSVSSQPLSCLSSPVPPPHPPLSAGALLQLPPSPSRNQSLRVASEPGGGGQVNSGAPGAGAPQAPSSTGASFFVAEPRQKPPGLARILVCPEDTCVCGVGKWTRATFPYLSLKKKFFAVEVVHCCHPKLRG